MPSHDPKAQDRRNLLGDLESIQQLLDESDNAADISPEKVPILLDTVPNLIPILHDVVDSALDESLDRASALLQENTQVISPPHSSAPDSAVTGSTAPAHPVTNATEAQLLTEGEQLVENLIEEYLPMIESRLREQLKLRLNFIIKEQMRKYR